MQFLFMQIRIIAGVDEQGVQHELDAFLPIEKKPITVDSFIDAHDQKREIVTAQLKTRKEIRLCSNALFSQLDSKTVQRILVELDERIDETCHFFLRFDRQKYVHENILELTNSGDCIHFTFAVAAFPKRKESAMQTLEKYLNTFI